MANQHQLTPEIRAELERRLESAKDMIPAVRRLKEAGFTTEILGDAELQQTALDAMYMEMVVDPTDKYAAKDRIAAGHGLQRLKGYGQEEKMKRIGEQVNEIKRALKAPAPKQLGTLDAEAVKE